MLWLIVLLLHSLSSFNANGLCVRSWENIGKAGRKRSGNRMVILSPRRGVRWLGGHDRHLGAAFSVRMLPVRRRSFALLHTHPGEQRFITELCWRREHTYNNTPTYWQTHTLAHAWKTTHTHRREGIYNWNVVNMGPLVEHTHRADLKSAVLYNPEAILYHFKQCYSQVLYSYSYWVIHFNIYGARGILPCTHMVLNNCAIHLRRKRCLALLSFTHLRDP